MTDQQKAQALLVYLEGLDSKTVVNALSSLIDNEDLASLYDNLVEAGVEL